MFLCLQPGTKVMIVPSVKDEDLPKLFPKGVEEVSMPSGITYVRTTTDYWVLYLSFIFCDSAPYIERNI
jgi:hypothetical protein